MKIQFEIELDKDDLEVLQNQFETVEFVGNKEVGYSEVTIYTEELIELELEEFLIPWLDMGYSLEYDKNIDKYVIVDNI